MKRLRFPLLLLLLTIFAAGCDMIPKITENGKEARLSFSSFDGGGPQYTCVLENPELVSVESRRVYAKANHEELDGAGYTVTFVFKGKKPGETVLTVSAFSPIAEEPETRYTVTVDETLKVTLTELPPGVSPILPPANAMLAMETADRVYYAAPADTPAALAFTEKLNSGAVEVELQLSGRGLAGTLPWPLTEDGEETSARPGLLLLTGEESVRLCFDTEEIPGVPLADFGELPPEFLEKGQQAVCLWLEWSE